MMGGLRDKWSSLPPLHRTRLWQGIGAYALLMAALGGYAVWQHDRGAADIAARVPQIESEIKHVYLTPQTGNLSNTDVNLAALNNETQPGGILLIVTDLGFAQKADARAVNDLPPGVALAYSPFGPDTKASAADAAAKKRPIIALLPMEPESYPKDDPGPDALLTRNSTTDNQRALKRMLAAVPSATAGMNFMGSRFLEDTESVGMVFDTLEQRKMTYISAPATLDSAVPGVARARKSPYVNVDIIVDGSATENDIREQLGQLESLSRQRGIAVGVVHPLPLTFALLGNWLPTLEGRNLQLVGISDAAALQAKQPAAPAAVTATPAAATPDAMAPLSPVMPAAEGEAAPPAPPVPHAAQTPEHHDAD